MLSAWKLSSSVSTSGPSYVTNPNWWKTRALPRSVSDRTRCRAPGVARRVIGRDVECLEVELVGLDLRPLVRDEPELVEDSRDLSLGLGPDALPSARGRAPGDRAGC